MQLIRDTTKKEEKTSLNVHLLYHLILFECFSNQPNNKQNHVRRVSRRFQSFIRSYVGAIIENKTEWRLEDLYSTFCFRFAVHMAALKLSTPTNMFFMYRFVVAAATAATFPVNMEYGT